MKKKTFSFEDLEVYQKLCELHLKIHDLTFKFPAFELRENGSELRRSSNAAPACIAEGYSNKDIKHYIEQLNKALGEIRQTKHYLAIAFKKNYVDKATYVDLTREYDTCQKMLKILEKSINAKRSRHNSFTKNQYPNSYRL